MPSRVRRIRVRSKAHAQPAAPRHADESVVEWVSKYRRNITGVVVAVAVVVLIVLGYALHTARTADRALAQIEEARSAENPETRIGILSDVLERYPRGRTFEVLYLLGNAYFDTEEFTRARETFERLLDEFPKSYYAPLAVEALGYIAETNGDLDGALTQFQRLTEEYATSYVARRAYMELGRIYESRGETDEAVEAYEALISNFPDSEYATDATDRIAKLQPAQPEPEPADTPEMTAE